MSSMGERMKRAAEALRGQRPPLMSHEQRQALIRQPFPWVRYIERSTWAGVLIPTEKDFLDRVAAPRGRRVTPAPNLDGYSFDGGDGYNAGNR